MIINLSPVFECLEEKLEVKRAGQSLAINGETYPFGVIPDGAELPDGQQATGCKCISGPIFRDAAGRLHLTLILPVAFDAPEEARFPQPIIDPPDGPISLPDTRWPPPAPSVPAHEEVQHGND